MRPRSRAREACLLLGLLAWCDAGCVVREVDLSKPDLAGLCGPRERYDIDAQECVPCHYLEPHPFQACLCHWSYKPAPLPYCDEPDAYYECLPCVGDLASCNAYDPATQTTSSCELIFACCEEIETGESSCCPAQMTLSCDQDGATPAVVQCVREGT